MAAHRLTDKGRAAVLARIEAFRAMLDGPTELDGNGCVDFVGNTLLPGGDWFEPVPPPGIDDPVELPLDIEADDVNHILRIERLEMVTGKPSEQAWLAVTVHGDLVGVVLTAEQCRDAARALWRLANEAEAAD